MTAPWVCVEEVARRKTALRFLLASKVAMLVAWAPEFAQVYKHGHGPILGGR